MGWEDGLGRQTERQKGTSVDLGPRPKRTNVRLVYLYCHWRSSPRATFYNMADAAAAASEKKKETPASASKWTSIMRSVLPRRRWLPAFSGTVSL